MGLNQASSARRASWAHLARLTILPTLAFLILVVVINIADVPTIESPGIWIPPVTLNGEELSGESDEEQLCFNPPLSDDPIPSLAAVASLPPPAPSNTSCSPPPLPPLPSCSDPAFTGKVLPTRRKIVHMILFGFEVDTLEIQLREAADLVDHYFIVEATLTHKGEPKPVLWERLR